MKRFLLILQICSSLQVVGQHLIPEFEFNLGITNNSGYRDSVKLGYDRRADALIDTIFNEVDISNIPINSKLDFRYSFNITNDFHLKSSINIYNCSENNPILPPQGYPSSQFVGFYSNSFPIIIRWDKNLFKADSCRDKSFITRVNWNTFDFNNPNQLPKVEVYLEDVDSLELTKEYLDSTNYQFQARRNYYNVQLDNGENGTFYMVYLGITNKPLTVLLDNKNPSQVIKYSIFPNPASEYLEFTCESECLLSIYDIYGKIVKSVNYNNANQLMKVDISSLIKGYYIVNCQFENLNSIKYRFIKS